MDLEGGKGKSRRGKGRGAPMVSREGSHKKEITREKGKGTRPKGARNRTA